MSNFLNEETIRPKGFRIEVEKGDSGKWFYRVVSSNKNTNTTAEVYSKSKSSAIIAAKDHRKAWAKQFHKTADRLYLKDVAGRMPIYVKDKGLWSFYTR